MTRVLVLNATYAPINVCTISRAVVLLLKNKAEVIERTETILHAETMSLDCPAVIRLVTYVRIPYDTKRRITRRSILARDNWICQYCGSDDRLTIDHVIPRSKGGEHVWENVVASCSPCNHRKGDALLRDVGMKLRRVPGSPNQTSFVYVAMPRPPASWKAYLV